MTILTNARLVLADEIIHGTVVIDGMTIVDVQPGRSDAAGGLDLDGDFLMPGIVDVHTDNLERQVQPRSNARWPSRSAMLTHDAQCAVCGVTTVLDALCLGDLGFDKDRIKTFHDGVRDLDALDGTGLLKSEHYLHLRCELPADDVMDLLGAGGRSPIGPDGEFDGPLAGGRAIRGFGPVSRDAAAGGDRGGDGRTADRGTAGPAGADARR